MARSRKTTEGASTFTIREVTRATWPDMEALFESRGAPGYCWCMAWRQTAEEVRHTDRASRKRMMKSRVDAGTPVGLLAYDGDVPVAWCSVAPRETYRKGLVDPRPGDEAERIWSVVCFYAKRAYRGRGVFAQLLDRAAEVARAHGATLLEAYPVDPDSPSYRFGGFVPAYERRGFVEVGRAGSRRHVMRLRLDEG